MPLEILDDDFDHFCSAESRDDRRRRNVDRIVVVSRAGNGVFREGIKDFWPEQFAQGLLCFVSSRNCARDEEHGGELALPGLLNLLGGTRSGWSKRI
ncbi:hypothetical protein CpipJ_CPIJ014263 [Culex quinquefasciatus]|uniref:Uncharacterized protein n=1 Tax=Culex quinquefasciatus TaxID=7176 RepID=B0X4U8_CULQU|nr:hypothetical protein CpipJ_CPIJ014263 [Culex quinquefasciatus]|eukprot:XP_001864670.1 hypothetical protein CpipJ_CPIJ014263 [Culex quinquefasciatus]